MLNLIWTFYNLIILGASIAVASETRQIRVAHRVAMKLPATLHFADGRALVCETIDFAEGGIGMRLPPGTKATVGEPVQICLYLQDDEHMFPAKVVFRARRTLAWKWRGDESARGTGLRAMHLRACRRVDRFLGPQASGCAGAGCAASPGASACSVSIM
ncbi:PilZ domain-containing protein [Cupriavidus basilensis]